MADATPDQRDAVARLQQLLDGFGLGSLASRVLGYVQDGMSEDSIMLELQNTPEWKQRFAANEQRKAAGLPILSPAEYLATERSYRQVMQEAGVPSGFYDQPTDFTDFLSKDISPAELQGRVKAATDFVRSADPQQIAYMKKWYTEGDLIAFALDAKRAAPLVGQAIQAASIGGIASGNGLGLSQQTAEQLAANGVNDQQARQGFDQLGQQKRGLDQLASIDGQQQLTADQLARATFLGDATVNGQVDRMKSAERGRFSGSSAITKGSLSKSGSGL